MARTQSTPKPRAKSAHPARSPKPERSTSAPVAAQPAAPTSRSDTTLRQLAHELNSLLDGSMRCVGLARSSLQQRTAASPDITAADDGLGKAHAAMRHMASLLERAMKQSIVHDAQHAGSAAVALFDSKQPFADLLAELEGLLLPHAQAAHARLVTHIDPACQRIPAGPLGTVLMNGLRNALQACAIVKPESGSHEVHVHIACEDDLLRVRIDGPKAAKPAGNRIGLSLSDQIVRELGGEMALTASADIASLRICVPVERLALHA